MNMDDFIVLIVLFIYPVISAEGTGCPSSVKGNFGQEIVIECNFLSNPIGVYWFDETNDDEPLIRLEDNRKGGTGYLKGEYDVTANGSLVIMDAKWTQDMRFKAIFLDSDFIQYSFNTEVSVLEHCPESQSSPAGTDATIVCHFKPGFTAVYWFEMEDDDEPLIRLEGSHRSGKGFPEKYDIHHNGSLIIRRVANDYRHAFSVLMLSENFDQYTHNVNFQALTTDTSGTTTAGTDTSDNPCDPLPSPTNGEVIQNATIAIFSCAEGYHLTGSYRRDCKQMKEIFKWDGNETHCIDDSLSRTTTAIVKRTTKHTTTTAYDTTTEGNGAETRPRPTEAVTLSSITVNGIEIPPRDNNIPVPDAPTVEDGSHAGSVLRSSWTLVTLMIILSFSHYVRVNG